MKLVSHFSESLSLRMKLQHAKEDAGSRRDELEFFFCGVVCIEKNLIILLVNNLLAPKSKIFSTVVLGNYV